MNKRGLILAAALLAIGGYWVLAQGKAPMQAQMPAQSESPALTGGTGGTGEMVAVTLPELSPGAKRGQGYFAAVCAACHGPNAGGIDGKGPPLVHRLYVPGHHGDQAIILAARRGVQAHHWRFGNMPVIEGLTDADLRDIIAFLREVQRENGII